MPLIEIMVVAVVIYVTLTAFLDDEGMLLSTVERGFLLKRKDVLSTLAGKSTTLYSQNSLARWLGVEADHESLPLEADKPVKQARSNMQPCHKITLSCRQVR